MRTPVDGRASLAARGESAASPKPSPLPQGKEPSRRCIPRNLPQATATQPCGNGLGCRQHDFRHGLLARRIPVALLWLTACLAAIVSSTNATAADPPNPADSTAGLSQEDLEELVAPIALYPDMLLANVLAASVFPADVIAARTMRASGGDPVAKGDDAWDPSVRMVAAFPVVLDMMADYSEWTTALGEAYLVQAGDVMDAIQSLRAVAWDNGALQTTPQQVIVKEGPTIIIEPADPQIIFVPRYTPSVVFVRNPPTPLAAGVVGFGVGVAVGVIWSNNVNCNWSGRCVAWGPGWWGRPNRVNVNVNVNNNNNTNINVNRPGGRPGAGGSPWRPPPNRVPGGGISRPDGGASTPGGGISRPGGGSSAPGGGISRPGGGTWRPGGGASTPGGGISRPGGGAGAGGGSSIGGGSGGASGIGGGRPSTPPSINRPGGGGSGDGLNVPSRRPGGTTGGLTGGTARPNPPQARPSPPQAQPSPPQARPGGTARPQPPSGGQSSIARPESGRPAARPAPQISRPAGGAAARPAAPPRQSAFQPGSAGSGRAPAARPAGGGAGGGASGGAGRAGGARPR
ncbi:MAG: DUF3300 domain-containing protein [Phycisphaerales bacterium]